MAKKTPIVALVLVLLLPIVQNKGWANTRRDSTYLSIYEPTEAGYEVLNEVLNSKHQWLGDQGTYIVYRVPRQDDVLKIMFDDTKRGFFLNKYDSKPGRYYGCIIYKNQLFMLESSAKQFGSLLFYETNSRKGFIKNNQIIIVTNDRVVIWNFALIDGKFENAGMDPPSMIFDLDTTDF